MTYIMIIPDTILKYIGVCEMRGAITKRKNPVLIILVIALVVLLQNLDVAQKAEARLTSFVYSSIMYPDMKLRFERVEYSPHFGQYLVSYRDQNGKLLSFMIIPKKFPFFITFDPIKQG